MRARAALARPDHELTYRLVSHSEIVQTDLADTKRWRGRAAQKTNRQAIILRDDSVPTINEQSALMAIACQRGTSEKKDKQRSTRFHREIKEEEKKPKTRSQAHTHESLRRGMLSPGLVSSFTQRNQSIQRYRRLTGHTHETRSHCHSFWCAASPSTIEWSHEKSNWTKWPRNWRCNQIYIMCSPVLGHKKNECEQHTFWLLLRRRPANSRRHILVACTKIICFYSIWHTDCAADKERIDDYYYIYGTVAVRKMRSSKSMVRPMNVCALSMFALEFVSTGHFAYTRSNDRWNGCRRRRCLALKTKWKPIGKAIASTIVLKDKFILWCRLWVRWIEWQIDERN